KGKPKTGAGRQILFSLLLLADLFMLYTIAMQLTHKQKAFETSAAVNWALLILFALGAVALTWLVIRSRAWKRLLCIFLIFAILYLVAVFSDLPLVKKYREIWISTAWSTMRHQGLATYYFPNAVVKEITEREDRGRAAQVGENTLETFERPADDTGWMVADPEEETDWSMEPDPEVEEMPADQKAFYTLFYELDVDSAEAYFAAHPAALANGYEHVMINESSLKADGTSIRTKLGEKVLAIDTKNKILIVEVDCDGSRGVLAIGKLASRLHLYPAANVPIIGETAGSIAKRNGGVLAMTGSSFDDPDGKGNGGLVCGYAMCDGKEYKGEPFKWGYKRLELREDNWFYINDTFKSVGKGTTDAMEFSPALVINGKKQDPSYWTSQNPRACIGQSERGEILMLCVEGRRLSSPGCSVEVCTDVLMAHDAITALNCDGGTTAIMWYMGEPIMQCSNAALPEGRHLPNAWVYVGE
ncbi:MAG: phosphodiester glycosidase family protein, partial [Desulfovibrio sp.]|nr:phosphodiester glycosidase family protein [Desulfovibrio sp.]